MHVTFHAVVHLYHICISDVLVPVNSEDSELSVLTDGQTDEHSHEMTVMLQFSACDCF